MYALGSGEALGSASVSEYSFTYMYAKFIFDFAFDQYYYVYLDYYLLLPGETIRYFYKPPSGLEYRSIGAFVETTIYDYFGPVDASAYVEADIYGSEYCIV